MVNEDKTFIRLVDEDGFESRIDVKDNQSLTYFLRNLKIGTKVQIRYDEWFGMDGVIVEHDDKRPEWCGIEPFTFSKGREFPT